MEKKKVILYNLQPRLGDALMLTSVVRDFKKTYPDISLGVMTARPEIFENNPHVDVINPKISYTGLDISPTQVKNAKKQAAKLNSKADKEANNVIKVANTKADKRSIVSTLPITGSAQSACRPKIEQS